MSQIRLVVFVLTIVLTGRAGLAQSWQPPPDSQRCPSKWGAGDQRGAANHMKPETVRRAAALIKTGESFELGRVLDRKDAAVRHAAFRTAHEAHRR